MVSILPSQPHSQTDCIRDLQRVKKDTIITAGIVSVPHRVVTSFIREHVKGKQTAEPDKQSSESSLSSCHQGLSTHSSNLHDKKLETQFAQTKQVLENISLFIPVSVLCFSSLFFPGQLSSLLFLSLLPRSAVFSAFSLSSSQVSCLLCFFSLFFPGQLSSLLFLSLLPGSAVFSAFSLSSSRVSCLLCFFSLFFPGQLSSLLFLTSSSQVSCLLCFSSLLPRSAVFFAFSLFFFPGQLSSLLFSLFFFPGQLSSLLFLSLFFPGQLSSLLFLSLLPGSAVFFAFSLFFFPGQLSSLLFLSSSSRVSCLLCLLACLLACLLSRLFPSQGRGRVRDCRHAQ
ncbi:uncharacterized protein LOC127911407 isoform X3 [Oncorhynchus keta]|uniref:uncharacterized protein LOC127911407 isoform X3 n=1 Tax=Oncorhynchus keta TaxID=8018 RepID=UPI00227BE8AD|nr:uncharacterized protein LOC127911407 isoform X3 [Oncorhynchus keta]